MKYYVRSKATGQVYELDFIPQYSNYEVVTYKEYEEWLKGSKQRILNWL